MAAASVTASERITVNLIAKAARELAALQERTGLGKTDIVNRAVTLYDFVDAEMAAGTELVLRRADGSSSVDKLL